LVAVSSLSALWWAASDPTFGDRVPEPAARALGHHDAQVAISVSDESALVARLRDGDEAAFRECYAAYYSELWRYAARLLHATDTAHDVVQDVFVALFTARKTLEIRGALRLYLFGATRHRALNVLRHDRVTSRFVEAPRGEDDLASGGERIAAPDETVEQQDIEARVMRALMQLPERQRSAMLLRWEHALPTAEIARVLGIADTVARRLLLKAATNLRRSLTGARN